MTTVDDKINAIRTAHGWNGRRCPTCGRDVATPFREYSHGRIRFGCVDAAHTGHLVAASESARWHGRPDAIAIRRGELAALRGHGRGRA